MIAGPARATATRGRRFPIVSFKFVSIYIINLRVSFVEEFSIL